MKYRIFGIICLILSLAAFMGAKYLEAEENKMVEIKRTEIITLYDFDSLSKYKVSYTTISKDSLIPYLPLLINQKTKANDTIVSPTNQVIIINSIELIHFEPKE